MDYGRIFLKVNIISRHIHNLKEYIWIDVPVTKRKYISELRWFSMEAKRIMFDIL